MIFSFIVNRVLGVKLCIVSWIDSKKKLFLVVPPSWQPKKVMWFCSHSMQSMCFDLVDFFFAYVQTVLCCNFCFLLWLLFSVAAAAFFCPATVFFFCCFVLCMLFVARCSLLGLFLAFLFFIYANVYVMVFFCPATVFFFCCLILCMLFVACSVLGLFLCFFVFLSLFCFYRHMHILCMHISYVHIKWAYEIQA